MNPEISIIVPVYNVEKYLSACVDSILEQTFSNFELILIDDGAKDNSGKICDDYERKDKRIKVIHKENAGVSEARNAGLEIATGEYIAFIDSDDCVDADYLEYALSETKKRNVDMFISGIVMEYFTAEKEAIQYTITQPQQLTVKGLFEKLQLDYPQICICGPWCKLYRNSIVQQNQIRFDKNLSNGEDTCFNLDYFKKIKTVFFSDQIFYHYRRLNPNSLFSVFREDSYDILDHVYSKMYALILQLDCCKEAVQRFKEMYYSMLIGGVVTFFSGCNEIGRVRRMHQIQKVCEDPMVREYKRGNSQKAKTNFVIQAMKYRQYYILYALFTLNGLIKKVKK